MQRKDIFDVSLEPESMLEKYGKHDLGRQCLLARRLLENEITFVQVTHSNYDTHNENFNFHLEQLGEFDQSFAALIDDLDQRGMLESTLVVVMSEFGRTPRINQYYGRDHWGKSWSVALAGCGIQSGAVIGKTNKNLGYPVIFDVTHSVQRPGGLGDRSGGDAHFIDTLAPAGVAAGVDGLFMEVHENPARALSDGPNAYRLARLEKLLRRLLRVHAAAGAV